MLDIFYGDYLKHCKLSAVNRDNNDGRRYTQDYRPIRERDYTLGISDLGLMLEPGFSVLDFGAQDEVFLDVCIRLQPALARTVAMDYGIEAHNNDRHFFQSIDEFYLGDTLYDIVTLWDVYEHIPDLNMFFVALAKRVVRGGKVLVQTPRSDLYADALGSLWHHFLPVQHLQLPSRLGIVLQFGRYGFKLVKGSSFGANAPPSVIPDPYKSLFDRLAKIGDLGSTQILLFQKD